MATNDELFDTEPPPPAYELNNAELDRKLADAAQRSLAIEQEQRQRPALPPLDEDGFPIWSEELFNYNQAMRQREAEAASAKLQSEYTRLAPSGSSGSASTSSPPPANQSRPLSGTLNLKQKEGRFGWLDGASQQIQQDEDDSHDQLNIGRPPCSPPRTQNAGHRPSIQVHVGPRPHDVLAQPQSPVSDPDDDLPIPTNNRMSTPLSRAPTYYPTNQTHPAPAPGLQRSDTRTSLDSTRSELPAWTAEAPSLDGPAYEEVEGGGRARRSTSTEERRQPAQVPVQARAHIQERVGGARRSATGAGTGVPYSAPSAPLSSHPPVPPAPAPVRPEARNAPRPSFAPTQSAPAVPHRSWTSSANTATSYTSAGHTLPASVVRPSPGSFNPSIAYRPAQRYNPTNMADPASPGGILEAQKDLIDGGVGVLYNAAVAATMKSSATAFKALPPPPNRMMSVPEDDASSVFSGRSGNGGGGVSAARMSVHSGDGPNRVGYVSPGAGQGYQGFQTGGQGQGFQTGGQGQGFQTGGQGQGYQPAQAQGYQPAMGAQGYQPQPQPGAFNPIRMSVMPTQPVVQPGYAPGGYQPNPGASRPLPHGPGFAPTTAQAGFVAPPPPPGMMQPAGVGGFVQPGRKHAKLYKRL